MPYIDGFLLAVPTDGKEKYKAFAERLWPIFEKLGAIAMWECWGDDVPDGEVTSFRQAVKAGEDETVVFSWTSWPDKAKREAAWEKMMTDPAFEEAMKGMPMDGKRMIYGGFTPILATGPTLPD